MCTIHERIEKVSQEAHSVIDMRNPCGKRLTSSPLFFRPWSPGSLVEIWDISLKLFSDSQSPQSVGASWSLLSILCLLFHLVV